MRSLLLATFLRRSSACTPSRGVTQHPTPLSPSPLPTRADVLTAADVDAVVQAAAASVNSESMVIAVTDRQGDILAIYQKPAAPATATANFGVQADTKEVAVALARTARFFSNNQAPLSSRTVRYISGIHFPPGIAFTGNAALYGIENTNRGCGFNTNFIPGQEVPPARSIDGSQPGLGVLTGKADLNDSDPNAVNPGGVPLYKEGVMVGGVGVAGVTPGRRRVRRALGTQWAQALARIPQPPGVVVIDGIAVPFVNQTTRPCRIQRRAQPTATYFLGPLSSPKPAPEGDLVAAQAGPIGGLTQRRRAADHRQCDRGSQSDPRHDPICRSAPARAWCSPSPTWTAHCSASIACPTPRSSASTSRSRNRAT